MSEKHKKSVIALFVFFFAIQMGMSLTRSEFYPFSWFGIYSGRMKTTEAELPVFILMRANGTEELYSKWTTIPSVYRYVSHLTDVYGEPHKWHAPSPVPDYDAILQELKKAHLDYLQKNHLPPTFKTLKLYAYRWDSFSGQLHQTPTSKELLYEIPIHP